MQNIQLVLRSCFCFLLYNYSFCLLLTAPDGSGDGRDRVSLLGVSPYNVSSLISMHAYTHAWREGGGCRGGCCTRTRVCKGTRSNCKDIINYGGKKLRLQLWKARRGCLPWARTDCRRPFIHSVDTCYNGKARKRSRVIVTVLLAAFFFFFVARNGLSFILIASRLPREVPQHSKLTQAAPCSDGLMAGTYFCSQTLIRMTGEGVNLKETGERLRGCHSLVHLYTKLPPR